MTTARQERKARPWRAIFSAIVVVSSGSMGFALVPATVGAAMTELVVSNPHTGLAIDGFDPVAYFTDAAPKIGRGDLEFELAGVVWRFHNPGNRAAFVADPHIYMPRFGGYDPVAMGRGTATAGNPKLWLVARNRLYLFYNAEVRAAFAADPDRAIEAAERHWPEVRRNLSP
jgi:hypothetical protein